MSSTWSVESSNGRALDVALKPEGGGQRVRFDCFSDRSANGLERTRLGECKPMRDYRTRGAPGVDFHATPQWDGSH